MVMADLHGEHGRMMSIVCMSGRCLLDLDRHRFVGQHPDFESDASRGLVYIFSASASFFCLLLERNEHDKRRSEPHRARRLSAVYPDAASPPNEPRRPPRAHPSLRPNVDFSSPPHHPVPASDTPTYA